LTLPGSWPLDGRATASAGRLASGEAAAEAAARTATASMAAKVSIGRTWPSDIEFA